MPMQSGPPSTGSTQNSERKAEDVAKRDELLNTLLDSVEAIERQLVVDTLPTTYRDAVRGSSLADSQSTSSTSLVSPKSAKVDRSRSAPVRHSGSPVPRSTGPLQPAQPAVHVPLVSPGHGGSMHVPRKCRSFSAEPHALQQGIQEEAQRVASVAYVASGVSFGESLLARLDGKLPELQEEEGQETQVASWKFVSEAATTPRVSDRSSALLRQSSQSSDLGSYVNWLESVRRTEQQIDKFAQAAVKGMSQTDSLNIASTTASGAPSPTTSEHIAPAEVPPHVDARTSGSRLDTLQDFFVSLSTSSLDRVEADRLLAKMRQHPAALKIEPGNDQDPSSAVSCSSSSAVTAGFEVKHCKLALDAGTSKDNEQDWLIACSRRHRRDLEVAWSGFGTDGSRPVSPSLQPSGRSHQATSLHRSASSESAGHLPLKAKDRLRSHSRDITGSIDSQPTLCDEVTPAISTDDPGGCISTLRPMRQASIGLDSVSKSSSSQDAAIPRCSTQKAESLPMPPQRPPASSLHRSEPPKKAPSQQATAHQATSAPLTGPPNRLPAPHWQRLDPAKSEPVCPPKCLLAQSSLATKEDVKPLFKPSKIYAIEACDDS